MNQLEEESRARNDPSSPSPPLFSPPPPSPHKRPASVLRPGPERKISQLSPARDAPTPPPPPPSFPLSDGKMEVYGRMCFSSIQFDASSLFPFFPLLHLRHERAEKEAENYCYQGPSLPFLFFFPLLTAQGQESEDFLRADTTTPFPSPFSSPSVAQKPPPPSFPPPFFFLPLSFLYTWPQKRSIASE